MSAHIDYTNMLASAVGGGVPVDAWQEAQRDFGISHAAVQALRTTGALGFLDLPGNAALHAQSTAFAAQAKGKFEDVALLGIGGSALGPLALQTALCKPDWNALPTPARDGWPRLHVLQNVDQATISALLGRLHL